MFRNYLTIAIRHLKKNRGFSLLNMFGLSIGLACAILILLWIEDETSYNRFHKKYDHLYQVLENQTTAERRTRKIGIRKVLGATVSSVVTLLSGDFMKLVGIAVIIAWPISWYVMNKWLQDYAYRINIQWWVFALAGFLALVIATLTVSTQAIRAALLKPVKSLRTE
jgi:predicted lysophospholipase L1 biosynthesis ABC-type transport system permease subunit